MDDVKGVDSLKPEHFKEYFRALHGYPPFTWQHRLAQEVFARGWPVALDVPTGAGKTAVIDIAVFHLALEANRGAERRAPVRILFVVDRRLIVDAAHERASKIAEELEKAKDGVLERVATRLKLLAENGGRPLCVAKLRGGAPKDPDWVRTPAQPTVVVSTVDQVGSRLLFRGYGVSNIMKPVHAGLLGADALLLLDEAHLSQPFVQTAADSRMFQNCEPWSENKAAAPFGIVTLSATLAPADAEEEPFRLGEDERAEKELAKRLKASKPAALVEVAATDLNQELAERAWALSKASKEKERNPGAGKATVVAVVVNRVARARDVFEALQKKGARPLAIPYHEVQLEGQPSSSAASGADLALLIGRTRELERSKLTKLLMERMKAGRNRGEADIPLFVVATQTIEAGADLDFDAMVSEIAPLDCLRQRFGRLDRLGEYGEAQAAIVAASDQISSKSHDPIYGPALKETWKLLTEKIGKIGTGQQTKKKAKGKGKGEPASDSGPTIDFGIKASEAWLPSGSVLLACLAPRADAPVLLPRDISFWTRTSPIPAVDPEVSLYLHGPGGSGDVEIVWRADVDDAMNTEDWIDRVAVCPPSALEAVSVPIGEAKRWLRSAANADIADVERSADAEPASHETNGGDTRKALRWRGADNAGTEWIIAGKIAPGDLMVVPSARGGCDRWGWAPQSKQPVADLGRAANLEHRDRNILRLTRADLGIDTEDERALAERLSDMSADDVIADFKPRLLQGANDVNRAWSKPRVLYSSADVPLAIEQRARKRDGDATTEDDDSFRSTMPVPLTPHCAGVRPSGARIC